MPCFSPLQATFSLRADGKKDIRFSDVNSDLFRQGIKPLGDNNLSIPCGKCMGCRLERSRQWAVRCMHQASCHDDNVFLTLTYDPEFLPVDGSLDRRVMQNFIKKLRQKFSDRKIKVFYCGEYGEQLDRPHYHAIIFNLDFSDKTYWKTVNDCRYYVSESLEKLWGLGFCTIGEVTFESCAYVARYVTKKINGPGALEHYKGRLPEFAQASLKPGIGREWIERFGNSDVFPFDHVVIDQGSRRGYCKPPRYYDRYLELKDPESFLALKDLRRARGIEREEDSTFDRLLVKERCMQSRIKNLVRRMENI